MKRTRAFSLLEIMLVLLLMGLVGGMGLFAFQRATRRGEARGVTQLVAEELRGARNRAISQRIPVAVVLPGGRAQALYLLEGDIKPHVTRRVLYGKEYPQSELFAGLWPTRAPAGRDDIQTGANGQEFTVSNWQVPNPRDYVLMFTPAGTVKSNGWPHFDGDYHLVVSEGVVAARTGPPAGTTATSLNYQALSQVGLPSTISVSPAGGIKVQEGLTGLTSGVTVRDHALSAARGPNPPALWTGAGNRDPVVSLARLDPIQTPPYQVYPLENVSLVLEGTDPDGDPLYVKWSTVPANLGRFSLASESQMEWDPKRSRWKSCWNWTPPEGWPVGNTCQLRYQVSDGRGGSKTGLVAGDCTSRPSRRLVFSQNTPHGEYEIVTSAPDGKNATLASQEGDTYSHLFPSFSPDGQLIASTGWADEDWNEAALFVSRADGSQTTKIFESNDQFEDFRPSWSSDGAHLVYTTGSRGSDSRIWRIDPDGSNRRELAPAPGGNFNRCAQCSPKPVGGEDKVLFFCETRNNAHIFTVNLSGVGAPTRISPAGPDYNIFPCWSPDATKIAYTNENKIYVAAADGSSREAVVTDNHNPYYPTFSPDGSKIAYLSAGYGKLWVVTSAGANVDSGRLFDPKLLANQVEDSGTPFCWSPDGQEICWQDRNGALHTVNVIGPGVERAFLKPTGASNAVPSWWSP